MEADALSQLSMGTIAHVKDSKKELVRDVHRLTQLGDLLVDSNEGGVIVKIGSESSLILDVKAMQDLDPIMVDLKKSVSEKAIEAFSPWGDGVLRYQVRLCIPNVDEIRKLTVLDILFTREQPRSTAIYRRSIGRIR
ncbi:hypothetical protein MTR67_007743 [Solanum verrucosum]|uniref:Uncharacterized protein n=1 Tax=Solanum verrucosum TaxID=315347 RepID=A0AAF0Q0T2_SOLVR|nr:hypothetical protein MTR67_007743 [Solanum verrucosum]